MYIICEELFPYNLKEYAGRQGLDAMDAHMSVVQPTIEHYRVIVRENPVQCRGSLTLE